MSYLVAMSLDVHVLCQSSPMDWTAGLVAMHMTSEYCPVA